MVSIGPMIIVRNIGDKNGFIMNTERLISSIEQFGVDFIDVNGHHFLDYVYYMTQEQIDVVFRYGPNPLYKIKQEDVLYSKLLSGNVHGVYILQKFLEQDDDFLFLKHRVILLNKRTFMYERVFLADVKYRTDLDIHRIDFKWVVLMIENHQKKYFRLFDLLKHHID